MSEEDGRAPLQSAKGLCCHLLTMICGGLQTASLSAAATLSTLGPLDHMAQVADEFTQQAEYFAEPSLLLMSTQAQQLFFSLRKWARVTHPNRKCVAPKTWSGPLGLVTLLSLFGVLRADVTT